MENIINIQYFKTPFGEMLLGSFEEKLCIADWRYRKMRNEIDNRIKQGLKAEYHLETSKIIEETISQLNEYFKGERKEFEIPLYFVGTDFQKSVWDALVQIPFGKTDTYLGLSKKLKNEKAIRAVASANGANAISIIVPCHRIIGSDGSLVGYAGGLPAKKKLLELENASFSNSGQMKMF
jgi:methylated-DNA-[protein]-cysteine S-methyltransferase